MAVPGPPPPGSVCLHLLFPPVIAPKGEWLLCSRGGHSAAYFAIFPEMFVDSEARPELVGVARAGHWVTEAGPALRRVPVGQASWQGCRLRVQEV